MPPTTETPRSRIDRFLLVEELGRGGMGVVYRAIDEASGEPVAIKVLLAGRHGDGEASERFLREARLSASVRHPHLVSVLEQGWNDDLPYLVQELVAGPTVEDAVEADGPMAPRRAAAIAEALADALHHAHSCGLVHRDVKPGNVLLAGPEDPRLTDFGLALDAASARLTATGQVLGTPTYMAPEQAIGQRDVPGELSDQYSLGAVLYEMLSGRPPYEGDTAAQVLYSLVGEPPTALGALRHDLPRDLVTIVQRAMARQPTRRYASCAELRDDLQRYLAGKAIVARPPSWRERVTDRVGRRGAQMMAAMLLLGIVAGGAVGFSVVRHVQHSQQLLAREAAARDALSRLQSQLPGLDAEERERAVSRFLQKPTHEGTVAAADLLLAEAARAAAAGQHALATRRYAEAYARSPDPQHHQAALLGLADAFDRAWRFDDLALLVHTLGDSHPDAPDLPTWRGRAALARGELDTAAEAMAEGHPDASSVWRALAPAKAIPPLPAGLVTTDWDADGFAEAVYTNDDGTHLIRMMPGGPTQLQVLPPGGVSRLLPTTPPTLLQHRAGRDGEADHVALLNQSGDTLLAFPDAPFLDAVAGDGDGDGLDEVYVGIGPYTRHMVVLHEQPDGRWQIGAPNAALDAANSDITALHLGDHDRDGKPDLLVAAGAWHAYDLRLYGLQADVPTLLQRQRVGYVPALRQLADGRTLLVDSDEYPSREGFPEGQLYGRPRGLWFVGPDLVPHGHLPVRGPDHLRLRTLHTGDLDGDGDEDLVVGAEEVGSGRPSLLLWAGTPTGYDGPWVLPHTQPVAIGPTDDDPADEMIINRQGQTWVLGDGTQGIPSTARPDRGTRRVPDGLPEPLTGAWRRAELLVGMGLAEQAADSLLDLRREGDDASAALLGRAAELLADAGQGTRAADLFMQAARADAALRADAVAAMRRDHRIAAASELGAPTPSWFTAQRTIDLLSVPGLLPQSRRGADGSLAIRSVTSGPPLARAHLDWAGHHLAIDLDLTVERLEWGAGVVLKVSAPGVEGIEVGTRGWGGGSLLEREIGCLTEGIARSRGIIAGAATSERWRVRVDLLDGELLCALTGPDGIEQTDRRPFDLPAGPLVFELTPSQHAGFLTHQLTELKLHQLTLTAPSLQLTEVMAVPPPPVAGLADGSVTEADLRSALDQHADALPRWLRLHTATLAPKLARAVGPATLPLFRDAFEATLHHHPDDAIAQRALTVSAGPLLTLPLDEATDDERLAAVTLRARRGMAFRALGEPDAARVDLQDAAEGLASLQRRIAGQATRPLGFLIERELACLAADSGDVALARSHMERAVTWHPAPEVARDLLAARPELASVP